MKDYKGYSAKITMDEEQGLFHGEVIGISDVITFQGRTPEELTKAFHDSVDDYLAFCKERGEEPDKPYSGRFVVRLSPELHRRISVVAKKAEMSMNEWVVSALERAQNSTSSASKTGPSTQVRR
jgi:predicted HicB family RNase H-like nuclease